MKTLTLELALTIIESCIISKFTLDEDDFSDVCADNGLDYSDTRKYFELRGYEFV